MPRLSKTVTQKDVANALGVSVMTVSLALRNDPRITAATRARVREAVERLGYKPVPAISELMEKLRNYRRTVPGETLGLVWMVGPDQDPESDPYMRPLFAAARAHAARLGYDTDTLWIKGRNMSARRLRQVVEARGIRGLLLSPLPGYGHGHMPMDCSGLAVVAIGNTLWKPELHRASPNHFQHMMLVLRRLKTHRYRRIGLALPLEIDQRVNRAWTAAWFVHQPPGAALDPALLHLPRQWTFEGFAAWLREARPDVVVGQDAGLLAWMRRAGLRVPEDIGFACLDVLPEHEGVSGVSQERGRVAETGINMIVGQLRRGESGLPVHPLVNMIGAVWVPGATLPPVAHG